MRRAALIVLAAMGPLPGTLAAPVAGGPRTEAGLRIEGSVAGPDGVPSGGCAVILRYTSRSQPEYPLQAMALSDPEGRFSFERLPADAAEARLAAHLPGQPLATPGEGVPADLSPGAGRMRISLETRSTLRITFRVPAGLPPAEGAVAVEGEERWIPFAASEALLAGVPGGQVGIKYHTEAYGGGVFFVDLGATRSKDTAIDLARPEWVEGRVIDNQGAPVAGALYRTEYAFRGMVLRTGAGGVFRVRRIRAGQVRVQFREARFRDTVLLIGRDAGKSVLELRLDRGAPPIAGRVAPHAGDPRACLVTASPLDGRKASGVAGRPRWAGGDNRRAAPDASGAFSLGGLETETYRIRAECPAANMREDTAAPGSVLPTWDLGPARVLTGRITSRETGAPVESFALRIHGVRPESPEADLSGQPLRKDSLGRFSVIPRFEGTNVICASAPGFASACRALAAHDTLPAAIALERSLRLAVRARAAGGEGDTSILPGARVRVKRAGAKGVGWSGECDESGKFAVEGLGRGEYAVDVRVGGRLPFRRMVDLSGDQEVEARLSPGTAITGTLLQWNGKPPRGLRILAKPEWPTGPGCPAGIVESPVKPDGAFSLDGLGECPMTVGVALLWSRATPFLPLYRLDQVRPGGKPLEIRLPPPRAWEISAVSRGLPLPVEAEIHFLLPPVPDSLPGEPLGHPLGKVAFRGAYTLKVFSGMRYVVVVAARGYRERADTVLVPPGEDTYETRMELAARPELRGRIIAASAASDRTRSATPPKGWKVNGPGGMAAVVEADGSFRLEGLPPGPAPLDLRDAQGRTLWTGFGFPGIAENMIQPGDAARPMSGLAVDGEGRPVAGATVIIRRREAGEELERTVTDGGGRFAFLAPEGVWLACPEDPALACTRLRRGSGQEEPARANRVRFAAGTRQVTVSFKLPIPLPMRGAAVLSGPGGPLPAMEAREGEVLAALATFRSVSAGRQDLHAVAYSPAPSPAVLYWASEPAESGRLEIGLPGPAVAVTAKDSSGKPLAGVGIRFLPRPGTSGKESGRPWGEAEGWNPPVLALSGTDAAGSLQCLGVHPGRYWIYASHPTHAAAPLAWESGKAAPVLSLKPGIPIRIKVSHGGHPVACARAEVFDTLGNRAAPAVSASRDGDFLECGAFPPGRYKVAVAAPALGRLVRTAEVGKGKEANLEAVLPASGWLEVIGEGLEDKVFFLKDGNSQVTYLVRRPEHPPLNSDGQPGGSLLFQGIAPERYQLWMEGGRSGLGEVEIRPARLSVLDVGKLEKVRVALPARRG